MKKTLLMLFAAAAFVGCQQRDQSGQEMEEPSGAERDTQMQQPGAGSQQGADTNTNTISEPSGAQSGSSGQQSGSGTGSSGATGADQSGATSGGSSNP